MHFKWFGIWGIFTMTVALFGVSFSKGADAAEQPSKPVAPTRFVLRPDHNVIVFLGDSITQQRIFTNLIEGFFLTRYPDKPFQFRNLGWNGDTLGLRQRGGIQAGIERDLAPLDPSLVLILYGMNDAVYAEKNPQEFRKNVVQLNAAIRQLKALPYWVSPTAKEGNVEGIPGGSHHNAALKTLSEHLAKLGRKFYVDQFTPFLAAIEASRQVEGVDGKSVALTSDGVHPTPAGHLIMAWAILKGLNEPGFVSVAELDASQLKTVRAEGCKILWAESGAFGEGHIAFRRLDEALPMPLPDATQAALQIPGLTILEDLSDYRLIVTGLEADKYQLKIDGESAGIFSRDEFEQGIDMNFVAGPTRQKVSQLWDAIQAKNTLFFEQWREVQTAQLPEWLPDSNEVELARKRQVAILEGELQVSEKRINQLRKPEAHLYELVPIDSGGRE